MNDRYETTAMAIRHAEEALKTLKEFSEMQYKAKGETMVEQIIDYITNTLSNADYMCCGCKYNHLSLSNMKNYFVFYIYDNSIWKDTMKMEGYGNCYCADGMKDIILDYLDELEIYPDDIDRIMFELEFYKRVKNF